MYYKKKNLENLERKRSGYAKSSNGIYLDRNERPIPFEKKTLDKLSITLNKVPFNFYPELDSFYKKLSKFLKHPQSGIFITEGVSGGIKSILETLTSPKKNNILFPDPSFAMYKIYSDMYSLKAVKITYDNYQIDINQISKKINKDTAAVFIPNPNVPIESFMNLEDLKKIADLCKANKAMLVIDEVYYPFSKYSAKNLIRYYKDTLIMQSFSKAFGLAGIRLGYIMGSSKNIDYISKIRSGYEANSLSMAVAGFFMDNYHIIDNYLVEVKEGFIYLKKELDNIGVEYNGGESSNFIFINIRNKTKCRYIVKKLREKNIFVRDKWSNPFDNGFSVSGAPKKIMRTFIKEFKKAYSQ